MQLRPDFRAASLARAAAVGSATAAAIAAGVLLVLVPSTLEGQEAAPEPRVVGARFEARIGAAEGGAPAQSRVQLVYRLLPAPGVDSVPLKGLAFFGNRPEGVEAAFEGRAPAHVPLDSPRGDLLRARLPLPSDAAPGDTVALTLSYALDRAIPEEARDFDLVLPVLYVDWRPLGAPGDMFVATVRIPANYSVVETFPTVPKNVSAAGGERSYDFRVQVIPSMIRFRGHVGEPPLLTFARKVDAGVVLILLAAGAFGWWKVSRETA